MIRRLLASCFLLAGGVMTGLSALQIDTNRIDPRDDVSDLYYRVVASRFVVVGTVVKSEGVTRRLTPELLEKMKTSLDEGVGGSLYSIRLENVVCRQTDFQRDAKGPTSVPSMVHMFVPRDEGLFIKGQLKESLLPGHSYLLFLAQSSPQQTAGWIEHYQLEGKYEYYRTEGRSRGAVLLSSEDSEKSGKPLILDKVSKLCQAVRPTGVQVKMARLKDLTTSPDSVLREEAQKALAGLVADVPPGIRRE